MDKYYQPSGRFSASSFLYFILVALIALPILALIYTYLIWYIPIIYFNFFITLGFGYAIALVINYFVIGKGKVRSTKLGLLFGFLGALVALYFSWVIWLDLVINAGESYGGSRIGITASNIQLIQVLNIALEPKFVFEAIAEINKVGTWGIRGTTVSGVFLWVIWAIEFLIVTVIATLATYGQSKVPFCEFNNTWFEETILPAFNYIEDTSKMVSNLEVNNENSFNDLETLTNIETESHSVFTLFSSAKGENFLSIENKKATKNKKDEIEFEEDEFVEYIAINKALKEKLNAFSKQS